MACWWALAICLVAAVISTLASSSGAANDVIVLPSGDWSLTTVDSSSKNSGMADELGASQNDVGYIRFQPTANNKGLHLAQAANSIRDINATAAEALQAAADQPPGSQSAFTGQNAFTANLSPYLQYWGGKMMVGPTVLNVYLIFYGKWTPQQKAIIRNFVKSLDRRTNKFSASVPTLVSWWGINVRFYKDFKRRGSTPFVQVGGEISDPGSMAPFGSALNPLTHDHLRQIVAKYVQVNAKPRFPLDPNGAYVVLTGPEVYVGDFCQGLCAFHTSATFRGAKLAYTFVGNPATQCPLTCTYRYFNPMYVPPNGDLGADAAADKLGHELAEIVTNPLHGPGDTPGWVVAKSQVENADLCEWEYGNVTFERSGVVWNVRGFNNAKYLVQLNFNRRAKKCVLQSG